MLTREKVEMGALSLLVPIRSTNIITKHFQFVAIKITGMVLFHIIVISEFAPTILLDSISI